MTAVCTRPTGSSAPWVVTSTRAVIRPVMSADAATTVAGPDVDTDHVRAARYDGVELRVGASAAGEFADPSDQLPFLEPLDQLGGGDLGQPGELPELGSGQRSTLEQQFESRAVVDRAEQARRSGLAGLTHSGNGP